MLKREHSPGFVFKFLESVNNFRDSSNSLKGLFYVDHVIHQLDVGSGRDLEGGVFGDLRD